MQIQLDWNQLLEVLAPGPLMQSIDQGVTTDGVPDFCPGFDCHL